MSKSKNCVSIFRRLKNFVFALRLYSMLSIECYTFRGNICIIRIFFCNVYTIFDKFASHRQCSDPSVIGCNILSVFVLNTRMSSPSLNIFSAQPNYIKFIRFQNFLALIMYFTVNQQMQANFPLHINWIAVCSVSIVAGGIFHLIINSGDVGSSLQTYLDLEMLDW